MTYFRNDDDLFDYDPETDTDTEESVSDSPQSEQHFSSSSNKNKTLEDFISSAKEFINEISSTEISAIDERKVKLATSFHDATALYHEKVQTPAYTKSVSIVLNTLTNGDFTKILMFNHKEALILQRLRYLSMMNKIFSQSNLDQSVIKELFEFMNVEYSVEHVQIFYSSSVNISRFCLNLDRLIYKYLGEKLNLPIKQELLDDTYINEPDKFFAQLNTSVVDDYASQSYGSLYAEMANDGILQGLSNIYNIPFNYKAN